MTSYGRNKQFRYDLPDHRKIRIFKLDLNGEDQPLSGKLLSYIDGIVTASLRGFLKSLTVNESKVIEKLSGGLGYDALSWSWGPDGVQTPLQLHAVNPEIGKDGEVKISEDPEKDGYIMIRPALAEFLRLLRRRQHQRFLWIDAICIDQNTDADKVSQLPNLRGIYSNAQSVLIWMGMGDSQSDSVLSQLPSVTEALERSAEGNVALWKATSWKDLNLPGEQDDFWVGIREFLMKPWWSRLWTLQEAAVTSDDQASDKAKRTEVRFILCGEVKLSWWVFEDFAVAVRKLRIEDWVMSGSWLDTIDDKHAFDAIDEIRTCKESYADGIWGARLNALLLGTMRRHATFPRDMVFGQTALMDRSVIKMFQGDYGLPVESLFLKFGQYYIRQEPYECLLNHVATKEKLPGLPSWCPNFASEKETLSLGSRWLGRYVADNTDEDPQMYHSGYSFEVFSSYQQPHQQYFASRQAFKNISNLWMGKTPYTNQFNYNHRWQVQLVPDTPFIRLSGVEVDVVTHIVDCNRAADASDFLSFRNVCRTSEWHTSCLQLTIRTMSNANIETSPAAMIDTFARTIVANRTVIRPRSRTDIVFDHKNAVELVARYNAFKEFIRATIDAGQETDRGSIDEYTLDYLHVLRCITRRRRFFATMGGRIGIGPSDTQPGDRLCVAFFCPTPYLLRKTPKRFCLVGETYVHGLMYGEATEMHKRKELAETKWVIE